jgi:uncharacterized protein YybS (DUF2232 family)
MQQLEIIARLLLASVSTIMLFLGGVTVPPLAFALFPLVPQPVLSFGIRYGVARGMSVAALALAILLLWGGAQLGYVYSIFVLLIGLVFFSLGRIRVLETLVLGIAAIVFTAFSALLFILYGSWRAIVHDVSETLNSSLMSAVEMHEKMGFPQESIAVLKERTPEIAQTILHLLPAAAFVSLGLIVLFNIVLLCRRFPERRPDWLTLVSLREWKAPDFLVWGVIASGFALFIPGLESVKAIAANLLLVFSACYFFQGLAIIAFYFNKNNVPRFVRAVVYLFIVFQQIFTMIVVGLGLFDLWVDFRRLRKQDLNPSQAS